MHRIIYLDSSAWLKLYLDEEHSADVREIVNNAEIIASVAITWVEVHAALAGARRQGKINATEELQAVDAFTADWCRVYVFEVNEEMCLSAAELPHVHRLRGYDALQLAAALVAHSVWPDLTLIAFDRDIIEAAAEHDLAIW